MSNDGGLADLDHSEAVDGLLEIIRVSNDHRVEIDLIDDVVGHLGDFGIAAHIVARTVSGDGHELIPIVRSQEAVPADPAAAFLSQLIVPRHGTFEGLAIDRGEVVILHPDSVPDLEYGRDYGRALVRAQELGTETGYMFPLVASEPIGTLTFYAYAGQRFGDRSIELASRAARVLASGIEKCRLLDAVESQAMEVERTNTLLEASNRDLQDFAYIASHDLQEPLRKIQTFGDRLESKAAERLSDDQRANLTRMGNASRQMQSLINDLLRFSRAATRGGDPEAVNLSEVAAQSTSLATIEAAIAMHEAVVVSDGLPDVLGDPEQLAEVFATLIANSLKYATPGTVPRIDIVADRRRGAVADADDGRVTIVYRDNGIGFDPRYDDRIFEPFFRLHAQSAISGSGIGLAVCRRILSRYDATIAAHGDPGAGTTFTITFPTPLAI